MPLLSQFAGHPRFEIAAHEKVKRHNITCCKEFQNKFTPPQVQSRVKKEVYGGLERACAPPAPKQTYTPGVSVFTGHKKWSALNGRKRPTDLLQLSSWARCWARWRRCFWPGTFPTWADCPGHSRWYCPPRRRGRSTHAPWRWRPGARRAGTAPTACARPPRTAGRPPDAVRGWTARGAPARATSCAGSRWPRTPLGWWRGTKRQGPPSDAARTTRRPWEPVRTRPSRHSRRRRSGDRRGLVRQLASRWRGMGVVGRPGRKCRASSLSRSTGAAVEVGTDAAGSPCPDRSPPPPACWAGPGSRNPSRSACIAGVCPVECLWTKREICEWNNFKRCA